MKEFYEIIKAAMALTVTVAVIPLSVVVFCIVYAARCLWESAVCAWTMIDS